MTAQARTERYRTKGAGAGLVRVEVLVPPEARAAILKEAARMRRERRSGLSDSLSALYDEAFARFGGRSLWNMAPPKTVDGIRVVADRLQKNGGMDAWRLAAKILGELDNAT